MSHKNTSCWASIQRYQLKYFPANNPNRSNIVFYFTVWVLIPSQPSYLWPRSNFPLGWARVSVARSASLGPVIVAVFVVDEACGVVVWRLDTADRADLHSRFSAWFAAVLPLPCHPTREHHRKKERNRRCEDIQDVKNSEVNNERGGEKRGQMNVEKVLLDWICNIFTACPINTMHT